MAASAPSSARYLRTKGSIMIGVVSNMGVRTWFGVDFDDNEVGPWQGREGFYRVMGALAHAYAVDLIHGGSMRYSEYRAELDALSAAKPIPGALTAEDGDAVPDGVCIFQESWLAAKPSFRLHVLRYPEEPVQAGALIGQFRDDRLSGLPSYPSLRSAIDEAMAKPRAG